MTALRLSRQLRTDWALVLAAALIALLRECFRPDEGLAQDSPAPQPDDLTAGWRRRACVFVLLELFLLGRTPGDRLTAAALLVPGLLLVYAGAMQLRWGRIDQIALRALQALWGALARPTAAGTVLQGAAQPSPGDARAEAIRARAKEGPIIVAGAEEYKNHAVLYVIKDGSSWRCQGGLTVLFYRPTVKKLTDEVLSALCARLNTFTIYPVSAAKAEAVIEFARAGARKEKSRGPFRRACRARGCASTQLLLLRVAGIEVPGAAGFGRWRPLLPLFAEFMRFRGCGEHFLPRWRTVPRIAAGTSMQCLLWLVLWVTACLLLPVSAEGIKGCAELWRAGQRGKGLDARRARVAPRSSSCGPAVSRDRGLGAEGVVPPVRPARRRRRCQRVDRSSRPRARITSPRCRRSGAGRSPGRSARRAGRAREPRLAGPCPSPGEEPDTAAPRVPLGPALRGGE
jgi:hypothetical protein